jgi:hypothetical protein
LAAAANIAIFFATHATGWEGTVQQCTAFDAWPMVCADMVGLLLVFV